MKKLFIIILAMFVFSNVMFSYEKQKIIFSDKNNVNLYTQKNDTLIRSVVIEECTNEFSDSPFIFKTKKNNENLNISFNLIEPKFFKITTLIPQSIPLIIYISPGDSICFKLNENLLMFEGKNSINYNIFNYLNQLKLNYPIYDEKKGIDLFLNDTYRVFCKKSDFIKEKFNAKIISHELYLKIEEQLKFQYINWKLNTNLIPVDKILQSENYLNDIDINLFKRNDLKDNIYFHLALVNFLFIITEKNNKKNNTIDGLTFKLKFIDKNLTDDIKEYLFSKIILDYFNQLRLEDKNELITIIDIYLPKIKNKNFNKKISLIKQSINNLEIHLTKEVLGITLIDFEGKQITFNEILKKQNNKIKIFDFWASWCAPCIQQIKSSQVFRNKLEKDEIIFIYFSIDKKYDDWKRKIIEFKKDGVSPNQYLILEKDINKIKTFFNITSIPNYVILDNNNKIRFLNSPEPKNSEHFLNILKNIKLN